VYYYFVKIGEKEYYLGIQWIKYQINN
jgi:hypothetical protein